MPVSWGRVVRPRAPSTAVVVGHIAEGIARSIDARHCPLTWPCAAVEVEPTRGVGHSPDA